MQDRQGVGGVGGDALVVECHCREWLQSLTSPHESHLHGNGDRWFHGRWIRRRWLEIMEWSRAVEVMVGDSLSTVVRWDVTQDD